MNLHLGGVNKMVNEKKFLRNVVGNHMISLGNLDPKVVVVNADLMGTCRNQGFVEIFPSRSFNVGIAEQNMVSFAAGLAHEGFTPYVFSMAPFISMRACEQCRTDVAYGHLNVRFLATYAGCSGGISGATHWAIEDCAIMCGIPEMTVIELSDSQQAFKVLNESLIFKGPMYIRSGVEAVSNIYGSDYMFELGKASIAVDGNDGAIICSGVVVQYAVEAARFIEEHYNVRIRVVDMHTIKPIDRNAIISAAHTGHIVVAQDHNIIGGLGYAVGTVLAEEGIATRFKILGIPDKFHPMARASFLYNQYGYDKDGLVIAIMNLLKRNGGINENSSHNRSK